MTFSKTISALAIAIVTLAAVSLEAQTSYSKSWEKSSSWKSSWRSGPNGTHSTFDQKNNFKSNETSTIGGRTISNTQNHTSKSGFAKGTDHLGTYDNRYAQQKGKSVYTDTNTINGIYGGHLQQTNQVVNQYNNSQGLNRSWDRNGGYNVNGFNKQSQKHRQIQDFRGSDMFGNQFGQQQIYQIGNKKGSNFSFNTDPYGNRTFNQHQFGNTTEQFNIRRW